MTRLLEGSVTLITHLREDGNILKSFVILDLIRDPVLLAVPGFRLAPE